VAVIIDAETRRRLQSLSLDDPLVREVLAAFLAASLFRSGVIADAAAHEAALEHFCRRLGDWPGVQQDLEQAPQLRPH
jgi:hypothetical protein